VWVQAPVLRNILGGGFVLRFVKGKESLVLGTFFFFYLCILQNVVDQNNPPPGIKQLLNIGVKIQGHLLILIDSAQFWEGGE
jgi:hypothetical protein